MTSALLMLLLAPFIGGLLSGLDRRITASLQGRCGPPLLQPFYDVVKLWGKEPITVNRLQLLYAYVFAAFSALTTVLLALRQDLLMILFVLTVASLALILGGLSVQSPYSRIGGYREILGVLAYEPILVMVVAGVYLATGSFGVDGIFRGTVPLLLRLPLLFVAFLTILPIKMRKSPFDLSSSHHAHQEIVRGVTTEYSGPYLALIEIGHWYELTFVLGLGALFWAQNPLIALLLSAVVFLLPILVDNISARLTWRAMLRFTWTVGIGLSLVNLALLYLKWPGVK